MSRELVAIGYLKNVTAPGGETEFDLQQVSVKPEEGKLVLFPPFWTHIHRAVTMEKRIEYIALTWVCFAASMLPLIALTIVCVLTYTFEIVFGLAGTILMLPLLSFLYDTKTLVIYSVLPQILVAAIGLIRSPKKVDARFMAGMLAFAGLGAIAGFALFYYFSASVFQILLASAITAAGLFLVIAPHRAKFNPAGMRVMDTLGGASH